MDLRSVNCLIDIYQFRLMNFHLRLCSISYCTSEVSQNKYGEHKHEETLTVGQSNYRDMKLVFVVSINTCL